MNRWFLLLLILCGGLAVNSASRADRRSACSVCTPKPPAPAPAEK